MRWRTRDGAPLLELSVASSPGRRHTAATAAAVMVGSPGADLVCCNPVQALDITSRPALLAAHGCALRGNDSPACRRDTLAEVNLVSKVFPE